MPPPVGVVLLRIVCVRSLLPLLFLAAAAFPAEAEEVPWALRPLARPEVPSGTGSVIDRFVAEGQAVRGLTPSPEASRRVLVRRAFFDLTGLPPTPEEVAEFVADTRPDAYAALLAQERSRAASAQEESGSLRGELDAQGRWARDLDDELHAVRDRYGRLVEEHAQAVAWAGSLFIRKTRGFSHSGRLCDVSITPGSKRIKRIRIFFIII